MITLQEIRQVGKINKTHGIDGELSVSFFDDGAYDAVDVDSCLVMDIDGIYVPFFADGVRTRGSEALLIHLDGVDSQEEASTFVGRPVFMLVKDLPADDESGDSGLYAAQLIGFMALDTDGNSLGEIIDIDDSTDNPLFIIDRCQERQLLVPIVDDMIDEISVENRTITFDLPEGLVNL